MDLTCIIFSIRYSELVFGDLLGLRLDVNAQDARVQRAQQRPRHQGRPVYWYVSCRSRRFVIPSSAPFLTCFAGGWGGSYWFSQTMSSSANRTTFVNACVSAVNTYNLDGACTRFNDAA